MSLRCFSPSRNRWFLDICELRINHPSQCSHTALTPLCQLPCQGCGSLSQQQGSPVHEIKEYPREYLPESQQLLPGLLPGPAYPPPHFRIVTSASSPPSVGTPAGASNSTGTFSFGKTSTGTGGGIGGGGRGGKTASCVSVSWAGLARASASCRRHRHQCVRACRSLQFASHQKVEHSMQRYPHLFLCAGRAQKPQTSMAHGLFASTRPAGPGGQHSQPTQGDLHPGIPAWSRSRGEDLQSITPNHGGNVS